MAGKVCELVVGTRLNTSSLSSVYIHVHKEDVHTSYICHAYRVSVCKLDSNLWSVDEVGGGGDLFL